MSELTIKDITEAIRKIRAREEELGETYIFRCPHCDSNSMLHASQIISVEEQDEILKTQTESEGGEG